MNLMLTLLKRPIVLLSGTFLEKETTTVLVGHPTVRDSCNERIYGNEIIILNGSQLRISEEVTSLLAELRARRNLSAVNYFTTMLAFAYLDQGRKEFQQIFNEGVSKYHLQRMEIDGKFAELQSLLLQAQFFFGSEVQAAVHKFLESYETGSEGPSLEELEKKLATVPAGGAEERRLLNELYETLTADLKSDQFRELTRGIVTAAVGVID
jgi:hypothetical protein